MADIYFGWTATGDTSWSGNSLDDYDIVRDIDYINMEDLPGVIDQIFAISWGWT